MLTLFHAPLSRSTTIVTLIEEMGITADIDLRYMSIPRYDGTGARDPANPHPEGKVPLLVHDGAEVWERAAIITYLSDLYPDAPSIRPAGHPERGAFLSWLSYYGSVAEPVLLLQAAGVEHPFIASALRGPNEVAARLQTALSGGQDYILKSGFSAADLLLASPFSWFPEAIPDIPAVKAWAARPAGGVVFQRDQAQLAAMNAKTD